MSRALIGAIVALILFLLLISVSCPALAIHSKQKFNDISILTWLQQHPSVATLHLARPENAKSEARGFHLLVPASKPDVNLCKNILSSTLLCYPTPTIINWRKVFDNDMLSNGGSHLGKIAGVLDYLKTLDAAQDDDMVLMVDGYDIWFQVPFQLLLSRYNTIISKAEERLREEFGREAFRESKIRESIVFSCQKKCWPGDQSDPQCYAVPPAQLPSDLYGADTDMDITLEGDDTYTYARHRPRYLNSGIVMGPAGEMRAMFSRALELAEQDPGFGSDQAIFANIFGAQEYARALMKESIQASHKTMTTTSSSSAFWSWPSSRGKSANGKTSSILDPHPTHKQLDLVIGKKYDFGINLDYKSALGQPTVYADFDLDWVTYNDSESLASARAEKNVSRTFPGSDNLDTDIAHTPGPFTAFSYSAHDSSGRLSALAASDEVSLPSPTTSWSDVPLFNNLWTGITPAVVHHNAHRDGLKANREEMWDRIWFQPYARQLLTQRLREDKTLSPITNMGGVDWFDVMKNRSKPEGFVVRTDRENEEWVSWNGVCDQEMQEEVFRDGKGAFEGLGDDKRSWGHGEQGEPIEEEEREESDVAGSR